MFYISHTELIKFMEEKMKRLVFLLILLSTIVLIFILLTCNKNSTEPVNNLWFNGITETNADGEIISEDINDWGSSEPDSSSGNVPRIYEIKPAFPNPTYNIPIIIRYELPKTSFVKLFILDQKLDTVNIQDGMANNGIIPPPVIDIINMIAIPPPPTACSVFPRTEISIIRPTKQRADDDRATNSLTGLSSRTPKTRFAKIKSIPDTTMIDIKQANPFPARI